MPSSSHNSLIVVPFLPKNLSGFRNLIFLDLYDNQIERIEGLDRLPYLRVLMLGKNRISKIENLERECLNPASHSFSPMPLPLIIQPPPLPPLSQTFDTLTSSTSAATKSPPSVGSLLPALFQLPLPSPSLPPSQAA